MSTTDMTCEEVIEQMFDYLDRELDRQARADIDHHLQRCRSCFSRAEFERKLRARVAETGRQKAPERLYQRINRLLDDY